MPDTPIRLEIEILRWEKLVAAWREVRPTSSDNTPSFLLEVMNNALPRLLVEWKAQLAIIETLKTGGCTEESR